MPSLNVDRSSFLAALETVGRIIPARSTRPVMESVRLVVDPLTGFLSISGTDLETAIVAEVLNVVTSKQPMVDGLDALETLLPHGKALAFVKASDATLLELEVVRKADPGKSAVYAYPDGPHARKEVEPGVPSEPGLVRLTTDQGETLELETEALEEYPVLPTVRTSDVVVTLKAGRLRHALERVLPSAARDGGRYAMRGVLVELEASDAGHALNVVATDGRRLALETLDGLDVLDIVDRKGIRFILPRDAATVLARLLPKKGERFVSIRFDATGEGRPSFTFATDELGTVTVLPRAIDGEFPRYREIIPATHDTSAEVDSAEFLKRLKVVGTACSDDVKAVRLEVSESLELRLVAGSAGRTSSATIKGAAVAHDEKRARNRRELKADQPAPPEGFACNPEYLADGIKACSAETILLTWTRKINPIEVSAGSFRYILMPITIDDGGAS